MKACSFRCQLAGLALKSRAALAAENLFLRKQLAFYQWRKAKRSPTSIALRWTMAGLGRLFAWRDALVIVRPDTFVRWRREAFRLFWRWKSRPSGRPALPKNIRILIRKMDQENPTWRPDHHSLPLARISVRIAPPTSVRQANTSGSRNLVGTRRDLLPIGPSPSPRVAGQATGCSF